MNIKEIKIRQFLIFLISGLFFLVSCRGELSDKPPVHLNPNMDFQPKSKAQSEARPIPEDTVAFGYEEDVHGGSPGEKFLKQNQSFYTGQIGDDQFLSKIPMPVDKALLIRGQGRFNIYCAACHDQAGTSQSIIVKRGVGIPPPPDLASENLVAMPDGQIFYNVKNGIRNMPGYGAQLEATDLWAVVAYVRAIQASRTAKPNQVPENIRNSLSSPQQ